MSTDTTTEQATVVRLLVSVPPAELAAVLSKLIGFSVTPLADGQPGENEPEPPAEAAEDVELDDTDAEEESTGRQSQSERWTSSKATRGIPV